MVGSGTKTMLISISSFFLFFILFSPSMTYSKGNSDSTKKVTESFHFRIDPTETYQTIQNFGASDAWSIQFVGERWPLESREKIAQLLFSTETDEDGHFLGIGLSAWRFNIGGGSSEQGESSFIEDAWRRAECFLRSDGTYDWTRQAGQQWFLKKASDYGVNDFIGFVNSPPVYYTKNGMAWSGDGKSSNLKGEHFDDYAEFLAKVTMGIKEKTGVELDYISPFNEPQWDWKCCKQEGSPWNNDELAFATRKISEEFSKNLLKTKIEVTEAGKIDYLYGKKNEEFGRGNQSYAFFNPQSDLYLLDLDNVAKKVCGHSYWSTWDSNLLIKSRQDLKSFLCKTNPELEYWMTEYCLLEDNSQVTGNRRDLGMDPALYLAKVIHADLTIANASAWHWWLAVSPYDYKDGLIYVDKDIRSGQIYVSKMLWALGHFSRFVRPGSKRIAIRRTDNTTELENIDGLMCSAYLRPDGKIVVVLVNQLESDEQVWMEGLGLDFALTKTYVTTMYEDESLKLKKLQAVGESLVVPRRSIVTFLFE